MEQKKVLRLIVLVFILIMAWTWALKPKKIKVENVESKKEMPVEKSVGGIDLRNIEENFSKVKKSLKEIRETFSHKVEKIEIRKDPLKPWIVKKKEENIVKEEKKVEPEKPDFFISGILYDRNKSFVIIGNEVKEEGENIGNFTIYKILPEKIIVKDKMGNFFEVFFTFEKGEKK